MSSEIKPITLESRVSEFELSKMNSQTKGELIGDNRLDKLTLLKGYYRRGRQDLEPK